MRLTEYDWGVLTSFIILSAAAWFGVTFTAGTFLGYVIIYITVALIANALWKRP